MDTRAIFRPARATLMALAAGIFGIVTASAQTAEVTYTFKSDLSTPAAAWCINVPAAQAGTQLAISACDGKDHQMFGYEAGGSVTSAGYCLDGPKGTAQQHPSAGDPVVINECDGSDHQVWQLQPFSNNADVFGIVNHDGLCVTVDGATIGEGVPLILAQCAELNTQGWLRGEVAGPGPEFYWYSGHRYCWYDVGWHGPGWYWCEQNLVEGIGWGGPIGWHWWHHHGHPPHPHPFPFPKPFPHPHPGPFPHPLPLPHPGFHPGFHPPHFHAVHPHPGGGGPHHH